MSSELFKIRKKEAIEKLINKAKEYELIALDENESFGKRYQAKLAAVMSLAQANQLTQQQNLFRIKYKTNR